MQTVAGIQEKIAADSSRRDGEIRTLQYGRGLAALFVCLFHYEGAMAHVQGPAGWNIEFIFRAGHSGVEFFFILSGFIIFHAHRNDIGRPNRVVDFYLRRATRILPMFWFIVIPFGIAVLAISSRGLLTPGKFLLDILLIPRDGTLTLPAAWTLQHEVVFYLIFGLLILNIRVGIIALTLWQTACFVVLVFDLLPQDYLLPASTYFGFYNFGFLFGILIAVVNQQFKLAMYRRSIAVLGAIGCLGLLACFIGEWRLGNSFFPTPATATLTYFCLYSLLIVALLSMENRPRPIMDATLGRLGAGSYILYVIHEPLYSVLDKIFALSAQRDLATAMGAFVAASLVAVLISVWMHYAIERPMLRNLRRYLVSEQRPVSAVTTA